MAAIETAELAKAAAVALAIYGRSLLEGQAPAVPADAPISVGDALRLWHALQPVFKDHPELIVVFQEVASAPGFTALLRLQERLVNVLEGDAQLASDIAVILHESGRSELLRRFPEGNPAAAQAVSTHVDRNTFLIRGALLFIFFRILPVFVAVDAERGVLAGSILLVIGAVLLMILLAGYTQRAGFRGGAALGLMAAVIPGSFWFTLMPAAGIRRTNPFAGNTTPAIHESWLKWAVTGFILSPAVLLLMAALLKPAQFEPLVSTPEGLRLTAAVMIAYVPGIAATWISYWRGKARSLLDIGLTAALSGAGYIAGLTYVLLVSSASTTFALLDM